MTVHSPAKINLFLEVLGKREDGYHEIQTIYQAVDLTDDLTIEMSKSGLRLVCDAPELAGDSNLCLRAARLLQQETGCRQGATIHLAKRIPWGAGLGGGSSNAAATLLALNRLWGLGLPAELLHPLARHLGADVPFFLIGGCALGEGIGERLRPLKATTDYWLVLVKPPFHVNTGQVYQALQVVNDRSPLVEGERGSQAVEPVIGALETASVAQWCTLLYNRLEAPVMRIHPEVQAVKRSLLEVGACNALMSGSGSCVFGVFEERPLAEEAARQLTRRVKGHVFVTRPVGADEPGSTARRPTSKG